MPSEKKHTAGPWEIWKGHTAVYAKVGLNTPGEIQGFCVAVCDPVDIDEIDAITEAQALRIARANARLIAAAPELLEALEAIMDSATDGREIPEWLAERLTSARSAIRKARGGQE